MLRRLLLMVALLMGWLADLPITTHATTTITINGTCNLIEAIIAANTDTATGGCPAGNGADTLILTENVTLTSVYHIGLPAYFITGSPLVVSPITILGNGFIVERDQTAPRFQLFSVGQGGNLTLRDMTLRYGLGVGGALANQGGTVTLHNVTVTENTEGNSSIHNGFGQITITDSLFTDNVGYDGGAIHNSGQMTITNSRFLNNFAEGAGGAIANWGDLTISNSVFTGNQSPRYGGTFYNSSDGVITLTDSVISGSMGAQRGGAIDNYGAELIIQRSTIADNAGDVGGGIYSLGYTTVIDSTLSGNTSLTHGGAIYHERGSISLTNSTLSGNVASQDGGGLYQEQDDVFMTNVTVWDNRAGEDGGGVYSRADLTLSNTVIGGSRGGGACYREAGSITHQNSLLDVESPTCQLPVVAQIYLSALQNHGGTTATHMPTSDSVLIDSAENCPATDQRGVVRPQGAGCDIGAVEVDVPLPGPLLLSPADNALVIQVMLTWEATPGATGYELQFSTSENPSQTLTLGTVTTYTPPHNLLPTAYFWRVRALIPGQQTLWSPLRRFTVSASFSAIPLLVRYTTPTPTLTWGRISWATAYEVQVSQTSTFTMLAFATTVSSGMQEAITPALANGRYYWRVRAQRDNGTWSAWSAVSGFVVDAP